MIRPPFSPVRSSVPLPAALLLLVVSSACSGDGATEPDAQARLVLPEAVSFEAHWDSELGEYVDVDPKNLMINNLGDAPLSWTASTDVPWLTLERTSGTVPSRAWRGIVARVAYTDQPAGEYVGTITFNAPGAVGSPGQVRAIFKVHEY